MQTTQPLGCVGGVGRERETGQGRAEWLQVLANPVVFKLPDTSTLEYSSQVVVMPNHHFRCSFITSFASYES